MLKIKVSIHSGSLLVLLLCLCKSFKELFLFALQEAYLSKAGAKVRTIFQTTKCFQEKVSKFNSILELKRVGTTLKGLTPYYIIYKGEDIIYKVKALQMLT